MDRQSDEGRLRFIFYGNSGSLLVRAMVSGNMSLVFLWDMDRSCT